MDAQLRLLNPTSTDETPDDAASTPPKSTSTQSAAWRLSADTRKIGRQGVAQARAALHSARRPLDDTRRSAA